MANTFVADNLVVSFSAGVPPKDYTEQMKAMLDSLNGSTDCDKGVLDVIYSTPLEINNDPEISYTVAEGSYTADITYNGINIGSINYEVQDGIPFFEVTYNHSIQRNVLEFENIYDKSLEY